jgi:hypothetical protein
MSVIPAFRRMTQKALKVEASLGYIVRAYLKKRQARV